MERARPKWTFGRGEKGSPFVLTQHLDRLVGQAAELLTENAWMLLCTNCRSTSQGQLHDAARKALAGRLKGAESLALPADFAGDVAYAKSVWVTTT